MTPSARLPIRSSPVNRRAQAQNRLPQPICLLLRGTESSIDLVITAGVTFGPEMHGRFHVGRERHRRVRKLCDQRYKGIVLRRVVRPANAGAAGLIRLP